MLGKSALALIGSLLIAGLATAQADDRDERSQSASDDKHIETLYEAQESDDDDSDDESKTEKLTKEGIEAYRHDRGWGEAFRRMRADGHFKKYKNLGELMRRHGHEESEIEQAAAVQCPADCVTGIATWKTEAQMRTLGGASISCSPSSVVSSSTWTNMSPFDFVDMTLNATAGQCLSARDAVISSTNAVFADVTLTAEEQAACAPLAREALVLLQATTDDQCNISSEAP